MLIDVLRQLLPLPAGEPTVKAQYKRRDTLVHAHELVCQCDTERLDIGALVLSWILHLRLELECSLPDIAIKKEEPRPKFGFGKAKLGLQQGTSRVEVEKRDARQGPGLLPTIEPGSRRNEGQPLIPRANM